MPSLVKLLGIVSSVHLVLAHVTDSGAMQSMAFDPRPQIPHFASDPGEEGHALLLCFPLVGLLHHLELAEACL